MKVNFFIVLLFLFSLLSGCAVPERAPELNTNIEREAMETLITTFDSNNWVPASLKVSRNGRTVAYTNNVDGKQVVIVNGKEESAQYKQLGAYYVTLSPDGKHLAYVVHDDQEDRLFAVIDGVASEHYQDIGFGTPIFSDDSQSVAYAASSEGKWFVVLDGQEGDKYDYIDARSLIFRPDGRTLAYAAKVDDKWFVINGDKKGEPYDEILVGSLCFSPDGKHFVYGARSGEKWTIVLDDVAGQEYFSVYVDKDGFSPDSKHLAYLAADDKSGFVVLDGQELKHYWGIGYGSAVFSPDSQRLAYAAILKGHEHTEEEELAGEGHDDHEEEEEWCVVVDGEEGTIYNGVTPPVFSPDNQRVAYFAWSIADEPGSQRASSSEQADNAIWALVLDGVKYREKYDNIGMNTLVFSPDSKHVAFVAKAGDKLTVVVDGKQGKLYDGVVASLLFGGNVSFDPDGTLRYVAIEGEDVLLVEEKIVDMASQ